MGGILLSKNRIFLSNDEIDRQLFHLIKEKSSEDKLRKIAKRALREIVAEELTARQKQFIVLYYYENNTMAEVADICGVNVSTVSRTLCRARKNITDRIKYYFVRIDDNNEYTDL